VKLH
jgi:putative transposase